MEGADYLKRFALQFTGSSYNLQNSPDDALFEHCVSKTANAIHTIVNPIIATSSCISRGRLRQEPPYG